MEKQIEQIQTDEAPRPIGPYSQAVKAGEFLFVSGQIPLDPKTNKIVGNTIEAQVFQVFENIEAILRVENLTLKDVVRMELYLKDLGDWPVVNTIYAKRFSECPIKPARQTMQVAMLPMDVRIEISCIAKV